MTTATIKTTAIRRIIKHATQIAAGENETVKPGQPARFTEACTPQDCIWQGDLGLEIVTGVPKSFVLVKTPTDIDRQLVPGNTQGAKHCLDSLSGVTIYKPIDWNNESLEGPCLLFSAERTVTHPTHGSVTIPKGFAVQCHYQREWDKELQKERRARD